MKYLYVNGDSYPCGDELPNSREHMNHINRQHVLGEGRFSQFVCDKLNLIEYNYSQPGVSFTRTMRQTIDFIHLFPEKIKDTFFIICLKFVFSCICCTLLFQFCIFLFFL